MLKNKKDLKHTGAQLPLFVEKDEDGFYVVECPLFEGCYAQGKTLDQALKNVWEVLNWFWKKKTTEIYSIPIDHVKLACIQLLYKHDTIAGSQRSRNYYCIN